MSIDPFLEYLEFHKRYSPHTLLAYRRDLEGFFTFIQTEYQPDNWAEVHHHMVRQWMVRLQEEAISSRSINRKLSALKSFFKFLMREGDISLNPMLRVQSPKQPKKVLRVVKEEEMALLLDGEIFTADAQGRLERMIIVLFYHSGMRLSELINLRMADVDLSAAYLKVLGKRNKERLIPLSRELIREIEDYLPSRRQWGDAHPHFFLSMKGRPLYPRQVYNVVQQYLSKVSSVEKKSPHVLRHSFATHLLNRGADLHSIKELLGHASLSATQVYTHNSIEQIRALYQNAHPRGDDEI